MFSSYFFGALLWLWAIAVVYFTWGMFAVFVGLMLAGVGVAPMAALVFIVNGEWGELLTIIILLVIIYGSRSLGLYFSEE